MNKSIRFTALLVLFLLTTFTVVNCSRNLLGKPPGESVGSCTGYILLDDSKRTRFTFNLFRENSDEYITYLTIPSITRYRPVKNISFQDKTIRIEVSSPSHTFEGRIVGDSLKFKGSWKQLSGTFILEFDD